MEKYIKQLKKQSILSAIIFTLLGLLFICFPSLPLKIISYCISVTGLVLCAVLLAKNYKDKSFDWSERFKLSLLLLCCIVCIYFLIKPGVLIDFITILLGFLIILNGIFKLQTAIDMKRFENRNWWISLVEAGVIIALGLISVFDPFGTGSTLMIMVGIGFIVSGISDLVSIFLFNQKNK